MGVGCEVEAGGLSVSHAYEYHSEILLWVCGRVVVLSSILSLVEKSWASSNV
jgi:hypothetical protein